MNWHNVKAVGQTLTNPDGTVRSLNPSSLTPPYGPYYFTAMPAGTDGQYERCTIEGNTVGYNPTGKEPVVFGYRATDPTVPGFGAISDERV